LIYPEIGMDPVAAQLAGLRLAPVQYAAWGHPATSGYPTIDFFLSSAAMEPDGGERDYTEILVRLAGFSTTIPAEPPLAPIPSRATLGLPDEAIVFWCGQSLYKYLPAGDAVFAEIAARAPECRFVFVEFPGSPPLTQRFRRRLAAAFAGLGLDAERFCVILPRLDPDAFRAAVGAADIVLDSPGWSGCNSLLDALDHGLPIVTLPGRTMRSRHGAAILHGLGLDQLICASPEAYIATAVALAKERAAREAASRAAQNGRARLSSPSAIAELEAHIIAAVGSCRRRTDDPPP
jgi:predicted O-linked N-acetylglucosamine transferase (SPINDLY family)